MKYLPGLLLLLPLIVMPQRAYGARISAVIGPPTLGQGGSNPLSIPPGNPVDWQVSYINDAGREWMLSIIPGIFYGQRFQIDQVTIGLGGGILVSSNGLGVGVYQSVGWETLPFWKVYRAEVEYRQVIGLAAEGTEFPYTLRIGVSYEFKN